MNQFSGLEKKSRFSREIVPAKTVLCNPTSGVTITDQSFDTWSMSQVTLTEGHPWPPVSRTHGDIGGPFRTERRYYSDSLRGGPKDPRQILQHVVDRRVLGKDNWSEFQGFVWPMNPNNGESSTLRSGSNSAWPQSIASSEAELNALGATAIARCKPTNSHADLAVALAETLREGLPGVPGSRTWEDRTDIARGAGSEYLNVQFGWVPLVSDVQKSMEALRHSEDIWRQIKRDAGRLVRRSYEFPITRTTGTTSSQTGIRPSPSVSSLNLGTGGTRTKTRHTWVRRWFDGAFTYYLPRGGDGGFMDAFYEGYYKARRIYGLTLDPEVLWNLAPWSWFADWFVNAGDVVSNISDLSFDGLVMRFGYMMEHSIVADEVRLGGSSFSGGTSLDTTIWLVTETKQRIRASPYGFGLTWESFSPRQLAILAALGVTRG